MFWLWAMDNVESGDLSNFMNDEIAEAAGWEKDADEFVNALISSGFIDEDYENMYIHDWEEYIGKLLERRKGEVERVTKSREKKRGNVENKINPNDEHAQEKDCNERSKFAESSQDVTPYVTANITSNERSKFAGKSRVDKSRVDKNTLSVSLSPRDTFEDADTKKDFLPETGIDYTPQIRDISDFYTKITNGKMMNGEYYNEILLRLQTGVDVMLIKESLKKSAEKNVQYFCKVMQNLYAEGIMTYQQYCEKTQTYGTAIYGSDDEMNTDTAMPLSDTEREDY